MISESVVQLINLPPKLLAHGDYNIHEDDPSIIGFFVQQRLQNHFVLVVTPLMKPKKYLRGTINSSYAS